MGIVFDKCGCDYCCYYYFFIDIVCGMCLMCIVLGKFGCLFWLVCIIICLIISMDLGINLFVVWIVVLLCKFWWGIGVGCVCVKVGCNGVVVENSLCFGCVYWLVW